MDKIPESAAVNESVKLAKQQKLQKSSGFINAILRSFARDNCKVKYPDIKNKAGVLLGKIFLPANAC